MPDFFTGFATSYPALQQRCGPNTRINLEELQGVKEENLLKDIGRKITSIFLVAHPDTDLDDDVVKKNLATVARETIRHSMVGSGTRRLFVKTWTDLLSDARDSGMQTVEAEHVERLIEGANQYLASKEQEEAASDGE
jgi:hypothetical protein